MPFCGYEWETEIRGVGEREVSRAYETIRGYARKGPLDGKESMEDCVVAQRWNTQTG